MSYLLVNDEKKIKLYDLDNENSVNVRIASYLHTLPKYLSSLEHLSHEDVRSVHVLDLLHYIIDNSQKNSDFIKFYNSLSENIRNTLTIKDIIEPWIAYNTELEKLGRYGTSYIAEYSEPLVEEDFFSTSADFVRFWKDRENYKNSLKRRIELNEAENKTNVDIFMIFEKIKEGIVYTDFKTTKETLDIRYVSKGSTILEVFNSIVLNPSIPFAFCQEYYKVLKDFIPSEEWLVKPEKEDTLVMYVDEKIGSEQNEERIRYEIVRVSDNAGLIMYNSKVKLKMDKGYKDRDAFMSQIMECMKNRPLEIENIDETSISGTFYFPRERIDSYVLSDLIMNNKIFSTLLIVDEHEKATKKRSEDSQPWIYVYFNHHSTGEVRASITQKIMQRGDPEMREADYELFPQGEPYIRVNITKATNRKSVSVFQEILSKLMVMYEQQYDEIVRIYEQYIPDFGTVREIDVKIKKEGLESIAPEIFVKNYSRSCGDNRAPIIVDEEEAKNYSQSILFPRKPPKNGPYYSSDGKNSQYYVCTNPKYPYIGLQENKLSNSEDYPFLPCCFKTDQFIRPDGPIQLYYEGKSKMEKEKRQQEIIVTNKILGENKHGKLPDSLEKIFSILNTNPNITFLRQGVKRDKSSFLRAVLSAFDDETGYRNLSEKNKDSMVKDIRAQIATPNYISISKQCNYGVKSKKIKKELLDTDVYLDPHRYIQVLEEKFKCDIYIFNSERLLLPRHTQGYYRRFGKKRCILVYEHWGSESDHAKYPQCELIIQWNSQKSTDIHTFFEKNHRISIKVNTLFNILNKSYILSRKLEPIKFYTNPDYMISQTIDEYGKTRKILVMHRDVIFEIHTSPMSPLYLPETKDEKISIPNIDIAKELLENMGVSYVVKKHRIEGMIGNVYITVMLEEEQNSSLLSRFDSYQKLSRYISEYLFWLFSKYIAKKANVSITDEVIKEFSEKRMVVIESYQYPEEVPKTFTTSSPLLKDKKLIVSSAEMLKRLLYVLKMYSLRSLDSLLNYKSKVYIENYYQDITDFEQHSNQIILKGLSSIDKWIVSNRNDYHLYENVNFGHIGPYFLRNEYIAGGRVFLAHNTDTLGRAINISLDWNGGTIENPSFELYTFGDIGFDKRVVKGNDNSYHIRIIGYLIEDKSYYTALLQL